ncbi:MAG: hypothetical protein ACI9D0_000730 [Bacteroidia bacterium]|jgi:hypothetical protein
MSDQHPKKSGQVTRREVLGAGLAAASFLQLGGLGQAAAALAGAAVPAKELKTKHLVLVAFAGGVRSRETFGTPANIPYLRAMADEGVLFNRTRTSNLGHFGAALSVFTGISEARGIRENARGPDPTLFEYLRKDGGLTESDVWISTSGGAQQTNYSASSHRDYGQKYGANVLDGDGIFNAEFKGLLADFGKMREVPGGETDALRKMRKVLDAGKAGSDPETAARIEKYILEELTRGTANINGPAAGDRKAIRVARNLITIFKPKVTGIVLQNADTAHGDFNGYVEVVRQNDAALGELWEGVKADPELRDTTSFIILPEFGRDRDLNSRRGLDHGDGSDDLRYVTTTCWGPDFKSGVEYDDEIDTIDVAPTVTSMFGTKAALAKGKRISKMFA